MLQQLIIASLFITALVYVGRLMYKAFQAKTACSTGCAKCGAIDFAKIEAELISKSKI